MAYQFAHVEGYARTAGKGKAGGHTVASIVAEVERAEGACPHVATPAEPVLVFGVAPSEAARIATEWADQATDARGHKLRKDGLCLLGGVTSMQAGTDEKDWISFKKLTVKWLQKEYGNRLISVVEHTDEAHPHLHFYAVPKAGERFDSLHDGLRAAASANAHRGVRGRDAAEAAAGRKAAMLAYVEAMRGWQDRFYQAVGKQLGMTRIGPQRRRLTRAAWKAQQHVAACFKIAVDELEQDQANLSQGQRVILNKLKEVEKDKADVAVRLKSVAEKEQELERQNAALAVKVAEVSSDIEQKRQLVNAYIATLPATDQKKIHTEAQRQQSQEPSLGR